MTPRIVDFAVVVAGTMLVGVGAYQIYAPLCPIVVGVILLGLVIVARSQS